MADGEEAEQEHCSPSRSQSAVHLLSERLEELHCGLRERGEAEREDETTAQYCQAFCQTLVECGSVWKTEDDPWTVLECYRVAILGFVRASVHLSIRSENVGVLLERLALSCVELLLSVTDSVPDVLWEQFQTSVEMAHAFLQDNGVAQLRLLCAVIHDRGMWSNRTLQGMLRNEPPSDEEVYEFLRREGPELLQLRVKHLIKENNTEKAALLAKACAEFSDFESSRVFFKQSYLVCLCSFAQQEALLQELTKVDCRDALEMICNLEADGDENAAFTLCSGFLTRQLLQEDSYCAWELTLFWSKLLKRLEPSEQGFLEKCQKMSLLAKTVFHLLFFIKVIQSELDKTGLSACVEMCIRALRMESCEGANKTTVCKTISCLLPSDLEVKRACQLTEFLLEPTVDSYYAVETLYNEPDQKLDEEDLPVPNSLRCELLLVFKTQWPFDPEFWDWKTLKRHCLGLMGEEASIVSSIDELNDDSLVNSSGLEQEEFKDVFKCFLDTTNELNEIADQKQKNREVKKLREKGFVSARFRNWQAYMQYCVLCDKEFLGHRIVRHAQTHFKDGLYTCPICTETFANRETLDPHVTSHVKSACKERLAAMKTSKKLANVKPAAPVLDFLKGGEIQAKNKSTVGEKPYNGLPLGSQAGAQVNDKAGNLCPVPNCRKGFKYFRNLVAHVRDHGNVEEAKRFLEMQSTKIVCQYCRRHFLNVNHLNDHLQVHCGAKPYTCIQLNCKSSFDTNAELLLHSKGHPMFKARCMFPGCGKIFSEAYKLYDHEAQHYKTFTCKVQGCGKVFHAQSQLDQHEDSHNIKPAEAKASELDTNPPLDPQSDQCNQLVADAPSIDFPEPPGISTDGIPANQSVCLEKVKLVIENTICPTGPGPLHTFDPGTCKEEPPDPYPVQQQIPLLEPPIPVQPHCHPPMPHPTDRRPDESLLETLINDPMLVPPCSGAMTHSYQSLLEDLQPVPSGDVLQAQMQTAVSQSHTHPLYDNGHPEYEQYNQDPIPPIQAPYQVPFGNRVVPLTPSSHNGLPAMPQKLPPQVPIFSTNRQVMENRPLQSVTAGPSMEDKERYRCPYETCSRDYSNYRSLTKHMKAAHCEYYTQWKLAKRNNKVPPTSRPLPMNGRPHFVTPLQNQKGQQMPAAAETQVQNTTEQPHYLSSCSNSTPNYTPMASHMETSTTQNFSNQMENILDPIVLSQLGNTTNQTPVAPHSPWNSSSVNSYQAQTYSQQNIDMISTGHSSSKISPQPQVQGTSNQGELTYSTLHHLNTKPYHFMPGQPDAPQSMNSLNQTGHSSDSAMMSCIQQPKTKSIDCQNTANKQCVVKLEQDLDSEVQQANVSTTESHFHKSVEDSGHSSQEGEVKKRKRSNRTKWPAIIRDGKFICCRCFREFQSPKSLGGHLSKRAICKPYEETVLSSDLPSSFLELLNSPHLSNTPESSPSDHMDSNQSWPLLGKGPLDPKLFPNVTFLHTNESVCATSSKPNAEISKQNSVHLEAPASTTQQMFSEAPVSYPQDGQSSVIQHTANIKENCSQVRLVNSPQSCNLMSNPSGSSDPLLSCLMDDEHSTESLNKPFTEYAGRPLQTKTLSKIKEIKERSTISNTSALSNEGLLAAMASLAQNLVCEKSVKEKLRDQILAGDFNRRNSSGQLVVQSSASSSPVADIQQSHVIHKNPQINEQPVAATVKREMFDADDIPISGPCGSKTVVTHEQFGTLSTQDDNVMEIQKALERLDLSKEIVDDKSSLAKYQSNNAVSKSPDVIYSVLETRGYACDGDGCGYRAMTKDALFKHLVKHHNYTEDMLNQCRKEQFNFAPFTCQLCPKTFTRNSNLRTHYQSCHNYSPEQIIKLGIARHYNRKSFEAERSSCFINSQIQKSVFCDQQQHSNSIFTPGLAVGNKGFKSRNKVQPQFTATLASGVSESMQRTQPSHQPLVWPSVIKPVPSIVRTPNFSQDKQNGFFPRPLAPPQSVCNVSSGKLFHTGAHESQGPAHSTQHVVGSLSLDKKAKLGRPKLSKPREVIKKPKEKKIELEDAFSPYRPYRCVHQGCVAAFTIQQNLILHYRAVHQSVLPKFEVTDDVEQNEDNIEDEEENEEENEEEDADENEVFQDDDNVVTEFLCQVKDCSRIFQTVTDLLQHYLQLHKMGLDRAGAMISTIKLGRFQCDQANCEVTFTAIWKYINHVDKDHKETKASKVAAVDGVFRCEVEGCTLGYSTRSNLLRHIMKKHQELYKLQLMNARRSANGIRLGRPRKDEDSVEKENREVVKKPVQKTTEKKKKEENNHWTKYGKPILKSKEEASAMCTKKIPLQYPCMIKGCETVTGSERHLMKHYVQHGLPKQDLEEQRSNYIFCKKMPRSQYRRITSRSDDTEKSDVSSVDVSENEEAGDTAPSESEFSKPTSDKESTEDTEASDVKVSTDGSSVSSLVKRKKGRPRKVEPCVRNRVTRLRAAQSFSVNYADLNSDSTSSSITVLQEQDSETNSMLTTFKPLGFEMSFIKFLEEESKKCPEKRKAPVTVDVIPRKKISGLQLKTATVVCNRIDPERHTGEMMKLVEFKNPQKLTSLSNVTFAVHRGLSNVFELLLKQLHDMRPAVIIHRERTSAHVKV